MDISVVVYAEPEANSGLISFLTDELQHPSCSIQVCAESQDFEQLGIAQLILLPAIWDHSQLLEQITQIREMNDNATLVILGEVHDPSTWEKCLAAGADSQVSQEELPRSELWFSIIEAFLDAGNSRPASSELGMFWTSLLDNFPHGWVACLDVHLKVVSTGGLRPKILSPYVNDQVGEDILAAPLSDFSILSLCEAALRGTRQTAEISVEGESFALRVFPVGKNSQDPFGLLLFVEDVTSWKQAESDLLHSQDRLSGIVNSAMDAIISIDEDQRIVLFNRAAEKMFGYPVQQVLGQSLTILMPQEFRASHGNHVAQFSQTGQTERRMGSLGSVWGLRANGKRFPIEASISQLGTGEQTVFTVILRDITERQQVESDLNRSRQELESSKATLERRVLERTQALEAANNDLRSSESRLLQANRTFTKLVGHQVQENHEFQSVLELIAREGCRIMDTDRCGIWLYTPNRTELHCAKLFDRSAGQFIGADPVTSADYPEYFHDHLTGPAVFRRKLPSENGEPVYRSAMIGRLVVAGECAGVISCNEIGPLRHWRVEEETFAGMLATLCSLAFESNQRYEAEAAQLHAKEEAELARDEAERANAAKSEFLSRMSHELRTPLNSILGFAQIMEMNVMDAKQSSRVGHILGAGKHLLRLVDEVLDIARVESGNLTLSPEPINLAGTVDHALDLVRPLFQEKALFVAFDAESARDVFIRADQQRISQVLLNLLSNAAKYNRQGGKVLVTAEATAESVKLKVSDSGPGIPHDRLDKLFQPFERLGAETGTVQGTGLGLALSRRLMEAMGGDIGVDTTEGKGSTFWFTLPRAHPAPRVHLEVEQTNNANYRLPGNHTVLYIEDNLENLQVIREVLEETSQVALISAMQGQMGIDLARRHHPKLILLDLHLPDMHGEEVLRQIRATPETQDIPVVIITADATPKLAKRLKEAGATEYLSKPLDVRQFLEVTRNLLEVAEP